ncbi:NADH:flavin oxidoreductase/NADH oxidase [Brachybacterium sp. J153]|uniref:NADH:flavin oxidoreductase/NADH oxidase n=1 Tax=Brachybacterium sp. J153 TaxID=3116488 RepID=UPI002E78F31C|nr:NADH:flavin oxidoreductase/NADH oxidase [Brachybacterium sp. J153]MEE1619143.1 NADH:flavin oxidoreductase/NADH oxidase [Brachybacterium sp. J153]
MQLSPGDPSPSLLAPVRLGELSLRNRIWLAPMCQYMVEAEDGVPTDWHLVHLGSRAAGGFGLVITEATAVSPEGRISPRDTGLWSDEQARAWARIVRFCREQGSRIAVQLAHAGRKASTWPALPAYSRRRGTVPEFAAGWRTVGPTTDPFPGLDAPDALSREEIAGVVADFVAAAGRAEEAGFDALELHFAHGYLVHEFLSPLVNTRTDEYGGDGPGRRRLAREIAVAVRERWPADRPLIVRLSATDWIDGGWDIEQSAELARELEEVGVDALHVSTGGAVIADIAVGPEYQVGFARTLREAVSLPVAAVGLITDPTGAQAVLDRGDADFVAIGRAALREPAWPLRAAHELGVRDASLYPGAYRRGSW